MNFLTPTKPYRLQEALPHTGWAEKRWEERKKVNKTGRLAYGGLTPGLVGCRVVDLSKSGVRIETFVLLDPVPEFCSLEFSGVFCRVRRVWTKGNQIGMAFVFHEEK